MSSKYPLSAVETLRGARADARAHDFSLARARTANERSELERAIGQLEAARSAARATTSDEQRRLEAGTQRALDLAWNHDRARGDRAREERLLEEERRARRRTDDAQRAERSAASSLNAAEAELAAVERHREDWQRERSRLREEREEQAALDPWNARRFGPFRP